MSVSEAPLTVLIVDDETDVEFLFRQSFRREIRKGKLRLHFAPSGQAALDLLRDGAGTDIVLVLSDINMPGMSGIQLLKTIKVEFPGMPVHIITAYGNDRNYELAVQYGADGYLNKPIDFKRLKAEVFGFA